MANIVIILLLAIGVYSGARRGLVLQAVHMVGYLISLIAANLLYRSFASFLEMLIPYPSDTASSQLPLYNLLSQVDFSEMFYNSVAYVSILLMGWVITRLVAVSLNKLTRLPIVHQLNWIGGAVLGFICNWLGLFFFLAFLSLIPVDAIQNMFINDSLARLIVVNTPIFSQQIIDTWMNFS